MAPKLWVLGDDGEDEGGGERERRATGSSLELERGGVKRVAEEAAGLVGELEKAIGGLNLGDAGEGDVGSKVLESREVKINADGVGSLLPLLLGISKPEEEE